MKPRKLLYLSIAIIAAIFTSCKSDVTLTGITVDQATLSVEVADSATLVATLHPSGATGNITWTSSNTDIATVKDGVVKGVKIGTANIVASSGDFTATCAVTVTESTNFTASLNGSEYYLIEMDSVTAASLGNKVKCDFRPDEVSKFLYIWNETYTAGTSTGPNFYGEVQDWVSLVVGNVGWSGAGFFSADSVLNDQLAAITANPEGYYLHIGIKSKDNAVHVFGLDGITNVEFAVGDTTFNDNGNIIEPLANYTRDGEWHQIEIPMSTLVSKGLSYGVGMGSKNILWFLSGGTAGTTLELDAIFIYKK